MPDDRTVLDHLLEGRDALQREVERLTAAIEQLDSVLGRLGTTSHRGDGSAAPAAPSSFAAGRAEPVATEPVNPPAEVEPVPPVTVRARPRTVRKPPAKKSSRPRVAEAPKSIRVHVLEMMQAENREFGLAEIIDRVHDAGIQAHDDAVRSITIKLMKDGRVERVGRGQYRLARRGSTARAGAAAPQVTETVSEPLPVAAEPIDEPADDLTSETVPAPDLAENEPALDTPADAEQSTDGETPPPYTPSLNLGQPWNS